MYIRRIAEAIDWIIRYLMAVSEDFFLFFWWEVDMRVQKAIVFISKIIHMISHEFVTKHRGGVAIKNTTITGVEDILFNFFWKE